MNAEETLDNIAAVIRSADSFLVTSHVRLDGDALGSELALDHALKHMGKACTVYNRDLTPHMYEFLPGAGSILNSDAFAGGFDAVFVLDCSDMSRVGDKSKRIASLGRIINIDHHVSNDGFGEISFVDPVASSTGELLYRLFTRMGVALSPEIATNLYTAIVTDTGSFRYRNTSSATLRIASDLLDHGADLGLIGERVYETNPPAKVRLLGLALDTLELAEEGTIGIITVTKDMLERARSMPEHTDGIVDFARSVEGVVVSIFIQEMDRNDYKVSLRSKGDFDVGNVANGFGGGGHKNAAACRIEAPLTAVRKMLLDAVRAISQ